MTARDLMKILYKHGIVKEKQYPYNSLSIETPKKLLKSGRKNRITGYGQIYTLENLKKALYTNGPCLISFETYNETERMWKQIDNEPPLGGHGMCVVGYNKEGFIIRNSWGTNWGNNGNCIYPYEDRGSHW